MKGASDVNIGGKKMPKVERTVDWHQSAMRSPKVDPRWMSIEHVGQHTRWKRKGGKQVNLTHTILLFVLFFTGLVSIYSHEQYDDRLTSFLCLKWLGLFISRGDNVTGVNQVFLEMPHWTFSGLISSYVTSRCERVDLVASCIYKLGTGISSPRFAFASYWSPSPVYAQDFQVFYLYFFRLLFHLPTTEIPLLYVRVVGKCTGERER